MNDLDILAERLEELVARIEALDEPLQRQVFELLDAIDAMHRLALSRLPEVLGPDDVQRLRSTDPALAWLLDAYSVGIDEKAAAERALEPIRPYIHSHGGEVRVLEASAGVVRVKLSGSCSGCTASAVTLKQGVERALQENLARFVALEVDEDEEADSHPPPGPTLLELENRL